MPHPQPAKRAAYPAARLEELVIVTPHSWGWTQTETAPELRASERITAVEIFKSCGPACSHASSPTVPASTFQRLRTTHRSRPDSGFGVSDSGAPRNPGPIHTNPTHPDCVPPLWHSYFSGCEGASRWAGRPCPCRSPKPEPGIPSLSPFAVGGQRGFVSGSPPSVPVQPQETRNQKGKTAQLLELQHPRRGVSEPRCPAFLRPRRRVWGHRQRGTGGGGERGGRGVLRGPPR